MSLIGPAIASTCGALWGNRLGSFLGDKAAKWMMSKNYTTLINASNRIKPSWVIAAGSIAVLFAYLRSAKKSIHAAQRRNIALYYKQLAISFIHAGSAVCLTRFFFEIVKSVRS